MFNISVRENKMCDEKEILIEGEPLSEPFLEGSLTKFIIDKWRCHDPNKTILIDNLTGESVTSKQLLHRTLKTTKSLQNLGLQQGEAVSFYSKTSINLCTAAYGALLAGAVVAPIDPNLKEHELRHLLKIHEPKFLFTEQASRERVTEACKEFDFEIKTIFLDEKLTPNDTILEDLMDATVDYDSYQPPHVNDPANDVVLIVSSSGTTGLPKGLGLSHNALLCQQTYWNTYNENTTVLQITQFFWITAINQWLNSIANEMCRVLIRDFDPEQCCKAVQKYKAEWCPISPADMILWLRFHDLHKYDLSSMKKIGLAGTAITPILVNLFKERWRTPVLIGQTFGASEFGGVCTNFATGENVLTVGPPLPGMQIKIVDQTTGKSLKAEETGEICLRGRPIMKGYIKNEEATREVIDEDGWYHTGDAGYYTKDNNLIITGRYKEIFKYKAAHISPTEMEGVILQVPGVKEVGVVGVPHPEDGNQPLALVVKDESLNVTADDIMAHVADKMAISRRLAAGVRFVDFIPRTSTGKIKRVELNQIALKIYSG